VPGIYRSQASLAPGMKVRMGTKPAPHAGMGVAQYAWSTSPLRRYVDLVNQWQIVACARHGRTAALAAPFKPKDAALFSVISGFDAAYTAYNGFQQAIERFWTLRWLEQNTVSELDASVMKDGLVRAETLPLVFRLPGTESLPRGSRVRARVTGMDLLTRSLFARWRRDWMRRCKVRRAPTKPPRTTRPRACRPCSWPLPWTRRRPARTRPPHRLQSQTERACAGVN
jgi:exoribonuclease-2